MAHRPDYESADYKEGYEDGKREAHKQWVGLSDECQCQACVKGIRHDSDCAVHNAPAYPVGECNCSVVDKKQWVGLNDEEIEIINKSINPKLEITKAKILFAHGIEAKLREKNG